MSYEVWSTRYALGLTALATVSKKIARYADLQERLQQTDVSSDSDYQRTFSGYYRMGQRPPNWYSHYFSILEREKRNSTLLFQDVLNELYNETQRVEVSFASKLLATVRPEKPVYE